MGAEAKKPDEAAPALCLRRPLWLLALDWGLPVWLLATAVAAGVTAAGPFWRMLALVCLLGLPGLGLLVMASRRPLLRRFDGDELRTRCLISQRTVSVAGLARVAEHQAFRNPIGTVRSLTFYNRVGQREVIESTECGYHPLRKRLTGMGLLEPEPGPDPGPVPDPLEVRLVGLDPSGLALVAFFLLAAAGSAGAGAGLLGGWPAVLLGPVAGIAGLLGLLAAASLKESLVNYRAEGDSLIRIAAWGRATVAASEIAEAAERWQANGGDLTLVITLSDRRRWRVDSTCSGYAQLIAWLERRGVPVRPPEF